MAGKSKQSEEGRERQLTSQQMKAIPCLMAARNVEAAAKASGIGVRTLHRWMADDWFRTVLHDAELELIDFGVRRLLHVQDVAIDTLEAVIRDEAAPKSIRVRAALGVLDTMVRLRELRNIEARLMALELIYRDSRLAQ